MGVAGHDVPSSNAVGGRVVASIVLLLLLSIAAAAAFLITFHRTDGGVFTPWSLCDLKKEKRKHISNVWPLALLLMTFHTSIGKLEQGWPSHQERAQPRLYI